MKKNAYIVNGHARNLNGWKKDRPDHRDLMLKKVSLVAAYFKIPAEIPELSLLPPVFDQSDLGSCSANMGCAQMEYLERQGPNDRLLSRLFLYARTRYIEGTPLSEDSGAQIRDVMKALAQYGVCYEQSWPYVNIQQNFTIEPPPIAVAEAAQHKALFYYRCPDLRTLRASLAQGFPVGFGFSVPESMMSDATAQTGLVYYPTPTEGFVGGHAVMAIGASDSKVIGNEKGAVLCRNSWGEGWGIKGNFWLPYRYFTEMLADDMWSIRKAAV